MNVYSLNDNVVITIGVKTVVIPKRYSRFHFIGSSTQIVDIATEAVYTDETTNIRDSGGTPIGDEAAVLNYLSDFVGSNETVVNAGTGWGVYNDGQYTIGSPLVITQGSTSILDIDTTVGLGSKIETQLPIGVSSFWDDATSKITPAASGDGMSFAIGFKAISTSNSGHCTICIDIGGSIGEIFCRTFNLPKGIGIEHDFYFTSAGYALDTFLANGGIPKMTSGTGDTSIYDLVLQVHRTHKAL